VNPGDNLVATPVRIVEFLQSRLDVLAQTAEVQAEKRAEVLARVEAMLQQKAQRDGAAAVAAELDRDADLRQDEGALCIPRWIAATRPNA
jgi:hypothetical protein